MSKLLALITLVYLCFSLNAQTSEKPNFVFIIMDDLNDYIQGFNGHPQTKTPNIAKIEKKGTTFINSYCAAPKCGPSRMSMITGKDCDYTKIYNNGDYKCGNFRNNFSEETGNETVYTIPEILKDSGGYYTYMINKVMHCHTHFPDYDEATADPCARDLSWNKMITVGMGSDNPNIIDYGQEHEDGVNGFKFAPIPDSLESEMADYIATDSAIAFINDYIANPDDYCNGPFFLSVGYKRPHGAFYVPEKYFLPYYQDDFYSFPYDKPYNDPTDTLPYNGVVMPPQPDPMWSDYYNLPEGGVARTLVEDDFVHQTYILWGSMLMSGGTPPVIDPTLTLAEKTFIVQESKRANGVMAYLAAISYVDAQIGRLYNTIKSHPEIFNNTIFVITSDHGYSLGEKAHWKKDALWETDIRIPLVIADMRHPTKQVCKRFVNNIDLFPTLLDMAEITYPTFPDGSQYMDGFSLTPLLANPGAAWKRPVLSTVNFDGLGEGYCFPQYSVRDDQWHYIRYQTNGATAPACNEALSVYQEELYHIGKNKNIDPYEWNNLIDDPAYAFVVNHLRTFLPGGSNYLEFDRLADTEDVIEETIAIKCLPNPASEYTVFNINLPLEGEAVFAVMDITGRIVSEKNLSIPEDGFTQFTFSVNKLEQGYYIAKVMQGDFTQSVNFVVVK